jgi:Tol biopolymer transport system component
MTVLASVRGAHMGRRRRYVPFLLPFALLVVLIPGPASPALAAFPGTNGVIAFDRDGDIWVVNADGTGERQLTIDASTTCRSSAGPTCSYSPAWSADGLRVAFERDRDIWVMNADGTGQRRVTSCATVPECADSDSGFVEPTFAPDGRLAFWVQRCEEGGYCSPALFVSQGDGSGLRFLTLGSSPAWSPRGDEIAFLWYGFEPQCGPQGCQHIYLIDPAGTSGARPVTASLGGEESFPSWTPDGAQLAFSGVYYFNGGTPDTGIYLVNRDGTGFRLVVSHGFRDDLEPAVSPDGTKLAYMRFRPYPQSPAVSVVGLDGVGDRIVAAGGSAPDWQPLPNERPRFCQIVGTVGDDVIEGTPGDDVICGLPGNDVILGRGGNDRIFGGKGNDTIYGGLGDDQIWGQTGRDSLFGRGGADVLNGGYGSDALDGGGGHDTCNGGRDVDTVTACESITGVP